MLVRHGGKDFESDSGCDCWRVSRSNQTLFKSYPREYIDSSRGHHSQPCKPHISMSAIEQSGGRMMRSRSIRSAVTWVGFLDAYRRPDIQSNSQGIAELSLSEQAD